MTEPDFEALRAKRNANILEMHKKLADEYGIPVERLTTNFNPYKCYCACGSDGPCEHKWDGEWWESDDGCSSATCSRCGMTAMSHSLRTGP